MEKKEENGIYDAIRGVLDVIKDTMQEQKDKPKKISVNLDSLRISMSGLKYPINISAKVDLDFSGKKEENKEKK
ncbi:MAG: hypothetical protein BJBARM5_0572 [Candidatus Parvarchaeum acidophilus ARMAN-5]|jgi:hypothetical protein|uniref:Uncharacterized protein n=1 Tax=Candidatus Parvarchaeum acidophilus ARMAN-5 TaxID=662762 RepID=D6GVQ9_PARA5|nr:MAG: hypothetical protein BJBARM5_0572 [Candidatus Parvarchaeum acidophilus ARMAN-5]